MRLLELTRSFYPSVGGLEKFVSDRLRIYRSLNISYELISTDFKANKLDAKRAREGVRFLKQYTPYNITPNLRVHLDENYDVLSVNTLGRYFSDYAILYAHKKGKRIILTPHLSFHTNRYILIKYLHKLLFAKKLITMVDKIVCFTEYERNVWLSNFKVHEGKIVVIPHYIDQFPATALERSFGQRKYLLYLGRSERNKRIDLLIEAFSSLDDPDYDLYMTVRLEDLDRKLQNRAQNNAKIILLGNISEAEKEKVLANCEALVLASEYEAFGGVLLEASVYRKPILCSALEVCKEILNPEGVIFFQNNLTSLIHALKQFINSSREKKMNMGNSNFSNLGKYSFDKIAKKYYVLFKEMDLIE